MGSRIWRWLVPDTPQRKAAQALAYLLIIVIALTVAGIKYAGTSGSAGVPGVIATDSAVPSVRGQGTKIPADQNIVPSRAYPVTVPPSRRPSPVPAPSLVPRASVTASATPLPPVSVTPSATFSVTPSASSPSPPGTPSAPASPPASPGAEATTATPAPGALRLTA